MSVSARFSFRSVTPYKVMVFVVISCFLLVSIPDFSEAKALESIGKVSIPVKDESNEERWRASYQGLSEVLLRLTGDENVLAGEAATNLMKDNGRYLLRFGYESMKGHPLATYYRDDYASDTAVQNGTTDNLKVLGLNFDYHLLIKDMQESGLPVWDVNRPELMFWWATEDKGVRTVLAEGENQVSRDALLHYAHVYGLPIKFPLMDMEDRKKLQISDLWGLYVEQLAKANKRYGNLTWVVGKHYPSGGKWHAEWTLVMMGSAKTYRTSSDNPVRLQKTVMKHISGKLAEEYAVLASEQSQQLMLKVTNIGNLESFSSVQEYLQRLFVVEQLSLSSIKGEQVSFVLTLKESNDKFQKLLKLDNKLIEVQLQEAAIQQATPLVQTSDEKTPPEASTTMSVEAIAQQQEVQIPAQEIPVLYYQWVGKK